MKRIVGWASIALWLGCGGGPGPSDGSTDASPPADGGCRCAAGQSCVRAVCLDSCGGDLSGFNAALGDAVVPIANFCRPSLARQVVVNGSTVTVFDVTSSTNGSVTTLVVSSWPLDPAMPMPTATMVATSTYDTMGATEMVFGGGYLAQSPSRTQAVFGVTTDADGSPGQVYWMHGLATSEVDSPGNFDAVFYAEDQLLLDALGAAGTNEGHAVYAMNLGAPVGARRFITNIGDYGGSVAVGGEGFVLASGVSDFGTMWPDGTTGGRVFVVSKSRVEDALRGGDMIDAFGEAGVQRLDQLPTSFTLIGAGAIVSNDYTSLRLHHYAYSETNGMQLDTPRVLGDGSMFSEAQDAGQGRLLFAHGGGLLLVQP